MCDHCLVSMRTPEFSDLPEPLSHEVVNLGFKRKEPGLVSAVELREGSFVSSRAVSPCSRVDGSVGMGQGCGSE